jgi:glycerophosphoryl diester phosphodiesterase
VPVVFHDDSLSRLTGRRGRIGQVSLAGLHALHVFGEPIPTLEEVLALTRDRAIVQIEIKPGVPVAPIIHVVGQAPFASHIVLASFDPTVVHQTHELAPRIPRMLIVGSKGGIALSSHRRIEALPGIVAGLGAAAVSIDHRLLTSPASVTALQRRGLGVWSWTVNRPSTMLRLAAWGADAILSDNPALLKATLLSSNR